MILMKKFFGKVEGYDSKATLRSYGYMNPFYLYRTIDQLPYEYSLNDGYPYHNRPYEYYSNRPFKYWIFDYNEIMKKN